MVTFGERLLQLRKANKLTQNELAKKASIGASTIGMYEQGLRTPSLENLEELCDIFNVDMDYMMGRTNMTTRIVDQYEKIKDSNTAMTIPVLLEIFDEKDFSNLEDATGKTTIDTDIANAGNIFGFEGEKTFYPNLIDKYDLLIINKSIKELKMNDYILFYKSDIVVVGFVTSNLNWEISIVYFVNGKAYSFLYDEKFDKQIIGKIIEIRRPI